MSCLALAATLSANTHPEIVTELTSSIRTTREHTYVYLPVSWLRCWTYAHSYSQSQGLATYCLQVWKLKQLIEGEISVGPGLDDLPAELLLYVVVFREQMQDPRNGARRRVGSGEDQRTTWNR